MNVALEKMENEPHYPYKPHYPGRFSRLKVHQVNNCLIIASKPDPFVLELPILNSDQNGEEIQECDVLQNARLPSFLGPLLGTAVFPKMQDKIYPACCI